MNLLIVRYSTESDQEHNWPTVGAQQWVYCTFSLIWQKQYWVLNPARFSLFFFFSFVIYLFLSLLLVSSNPWYQTYLLGFIECTSYLYLSFFLKRNNKISCSQQAVRRSHARQPSQTDRNIHYSLVTSGRILFSRIRCILVCFLSPSPGKRWTPGQRRLLFKHSISDLPFLWTIAIENNRISGRWTQIMCRRRLGISIQFLHRNII